ncbi:MAG: [citrate (pro-3S)-lyase] ligase, partial [Planctomycetes bacterium]|nr:[citrate (pro-3S)-lyase] ligase [Planctomycetota bacterium]
LRGGRVTVVASGKFVLSAMTFAEYFSKTEAVQAVDTTADVALFGAVIAPALDITQRFVGEEPACVVTRGYNEDMRFFLPPMGIQVQVLPRITTDDGQPISASRVRALVKAEDWSALEPLVPEHVSRYLREAGKSDLRQ